VTGPTGPTGPTGAASTETGPTGPTGPIGPGVFEWGAEPTIIWADSKAPGPGTGTPSDPYNSLQAAITAATTSTFANSFGMRARCIVLIASDSNFDEDLVIPPARHVQLLGMGPWVLGDATLANFASSIPRSITIQTNQAAEDVYLAQGAAFDARPVTVIGTFDNGTSVGTHTNYTDGAIISGDVIFQTTDLIDPFTTIELQLLNARVVGSIKQALVNPQQGILNSYFYNSRINTINHIGLNIQRMLDSRSDGTLVAAGYSEITNSQINGSVTVGSALADVPPTGIFSSQFGTITWTGPLTLDTASNYYFVSSSSTLVGTKTILSSPAGALSSVQTAVSIPLPLTTQTPVLSLAVTTTTGQRLKIDSMSEVEITVGPTVNFQYTILYQLYFDTNPIASVVVEREQNSTASSRLFSEIPNMTWVDAPVAGAHTYEIRITVTGTTVTGAVALTRSMNIIAF